MGDKMENEKIIIILLVVILALLLSAFMLFGPFSGKDVEMSVITSDTLYDGDNFGISLKSSEGTPVANAVVNVTIIDEKGEKNTKTITTDKNGEGFLQLNGLTPGKYNIELAYSGGNGYKAGTASHVMEMAASTTSVSGDSSQASPAKTVTLNLNNYDERVSQNIGEYKIEAMKWKGTGVGGLGVWVYKSGQLIDKSFYSSRGYICMNGQWKWTQWDNGEEGATYHKYPVSNDVEIQKVEVQLNIK